jgi:hypothetical protein
MMTKYLDLYCPYCGNGLEIAEGIELNGDDVVIIACESSKCGAQWSQYGTIAIPSKLAVDNNQEAE